MYLSLTIFDYLHLTLQQTEHYSLSLSLYTSFINMTVHISVFKQLTLQRTEQHSILLTLSLYRCLITLNIATNGTLLAISLSIYIFHQPDSSYLSSNT